MTDYAARGQQRVREVSKARVEVLQALLDLPLNASMREVPVKRVENPMLVHGVGVRAVRARIRLQPRRVGLPRGLRLSVREREWWRLGRVTARAIAAVALAQGERVGSAEVAKKLKWHEATARYHLQRAREAGIVEARRGAGYVLLANSREGLDSRAFLAAEYVCAQARRVPAGEVARRFEWTLREAEHHLQAATRAGLVTTDPSLGYQASVGAGRIAWGKSTP